MTLSLLANPTKPVFAASTGSPGKYLLRLCQTKGKKQSFQYTKASQRSLKDCSKAHIVSPLGKVLL